MDNRTLSKADLLLHWSRVAFGLISVGRSIDIFVHTRLLFYFLAFFWTHNISQSATNSYLIHNYRHPRNQNQFAWVEPPV